MWAGKKASYNSLTLEILLHFNVILMSYRFECGLYSSVASAQLRLHPKKTQDRLIRLLVIVRLKWSEQGRMFLNQMRGLRQNRKKGQKSTPPQENQLFYTISYLSLYADAEFTTIWSQFSWKNNMEKSHTSENSHRSLPHSFGHVRDWERLCVTTFCGYNNFNAK